MLTKQVNGNKKPYKKLMKPNELEEISSSLPTIVILQR